MAKRIFEADIESPSFVKKGGTSLQYLKADGSVSTGQRISKIINADNYYLETNDRVKTLIVTSNLGSGSAKILLDNNVFEVNDEIEIYNRTEIIINLEVVGDNITIKYKGQDSTKEIRPIIEIYLYEKIWLKCTEENVFDLVKITNL